VQVLLPHCAAGRGLRSGLIVAWALRLRVDGTRFWSLILLSSHIAPNISSWDNPNPFPWGCLYAFPGLAAVSPRGQRGDASTPVQRLQVEGLLHHCFQVRGWQGQPRVGK
jgi:hypothetical protein